MSEDLARRARSLTTPDISDAAERQGVVVGVLRLSGTEVMAGFARTARAVAGDADSVHGAVLESMPGEVVVVDFGGPTIGVAGIGDLVAAEGRRRGLAGVVLWGPARDLNGLREVGLPIFATGTTPAAGFHDRKGEADVPVTVGGVVVSPGDLVVGDEDGAVLQSELHAAFHRDAITAIDTRSARRRSFSFASRVPFGGRWFRGGLGHSFSRFS